MAHVNQFQSIIDYGPGIYLCVSSRASRGPACPRVVRQVRLGILVLGIKQTKDSVWLPMLIKVQGKGPPSVERLHLSFHLQSQDERLTAMSKAISQSILTERTARVLIAACLTIVDALEEESLLSFATECMPVDLTDRWRALASAVTRVVGRLRDTDT